MENKVVLIKTIKYIYAQNSAKRTEIIQDLIVIKQGPVVLCALSPGGYISLWSKFSPRVDCITMNEIIEKQNEKL